MFFFNLTAVEFLTLFGALGGFITALYLLDRAKKKKIVSTLRFWTSGSAVKQQRRRTRMHQPWSLVLQLLSLACLLLAIAQLEWGSRETRGQDHVLLLDTSSWTAQRTTEGTLLDTEKSTAQRYLARLPAHDRVMLVRVDGLATPVTAFTSDRRANTDAVLQSKSAAASLNIAQALSFARQAQAWSGGQPGEIVYIGPGLIADSESPAPKVSNLRVIRIDANREHCGIRGIGVKRSESDPNSWQAIVSVKNFGTIRNLVALSASFAGTPFARRTVSLAPGEEAGTDYTFTTSTAGRLSVDLQPANAATRDGLNNDAFNHDAFDTDHRAVLELPRAAILKLAVFTSRADVLRPLFESNHRLAVQFFAPAAYTPKPSADVMLLDRIAPRERPQIASLWLQPLKGSSPLPVRAVVDNAVVKTWHSETGLGVGLHAKEASISAAEVFETFDGDLPIANISEGPIVVARPAARSHPKIAVIGFDPNEEQLKFQVTTPLLFANLLRWLSPEPDQVLEATAVPVGAATVNLDPGERANADLSNQRSIQVTDDTGAAVPFTLRNQTVQLFASHPSVVRISSPGRERVLSLTLPDVASFDWKAPANAASGLPQPRFNAAPLDLWKWLAALGILCLLTEWVLFGRTRFAAHARLRLVLKCLSFTAIVITFAQPVTRLPETKTAAVILADTSASMTRDDLAHASQLIANMERHKHGSWMKVIPFARRTRTLLPQEMSGSPHLISTPGPAANGTDFENALGNSMFAFPAGRVPKLVLISDGNENEGSTPRAIAQLQRLHLPVDTIPAVGHPKTALRLASISMPRQAYAGEQIPIDLTIESPHAVHAAIEIEADGKGLGSNPVELDSGTNHVRVHARVKSSGATFISGRVSASTLGELSFQEAIELKRARVLYLSEDPPGTEANLLQAFNEAQLDLTRDPSLLDKDLSAVQLIVLNNQDLNGFSAARKSRVEEWVKSGGGLLLISGERQVYKEEKQMDALDRVLPAKLAPPKTSQGTCVGLIIDKSSSMEGRKIELARVSAIGVVDHLRPIDTIGVLIFDNSFQWAVPIRRAQDKFLIKRLISGITPDGGTQIAPALGEAYRKVLASNATYKHIVLLTDGISEEGDSVELAREAAEHQVTISTVGLGQDVNRSYLEKVAATSGGRSYFLNEPQGLEQILLKDVVDYSGSTTVEKPLKAIVDRPAEILDSVGIENAPPLKGYTRFTAKPGAETILSIDDEKREPLFVRWQYGLGRAAVFSSDAKSRWAQAWVTWPGFDKFWINVTRDLLTHTDQSEAGAQFDSAEGDIQVNYHLGAGVLDPPVTPDIFVIGPNGFRKPLDLQKIAPGVYHGRLHIGTLNGLFRVRPVKDSAAFPETGLYRREEEFEDHGSNVQLLQQISALTGGRFNPPLSSIFDPGGRSIYVTWQLWPALLALAIALTIAELLVRKWNGLMQSFLNASPFRSDRFAETDRAA